VCSLGRREAGVYEPENPCFRREQCHPPIQPSYTSPSTPSSISAKNKQSSDFFQARIYEDYLLLYYVNYFVSKNWGACERVFLRGCKGGAWGLWVSGRDGIAYPPSLLFMVTN